MFNLNPQADFAPKSTGGCVTKLFHEQLLYIYRIAKYNIRIRLISKKYDILL
jgi:hypothetical protein